MNSLYIFLAFSMFLPTAEMEHEPKNTQILFPEFTVFFPNYNACTCYIDEYTEAVNFDGDTSKITFERYENGTFSMRAKSDSITLYEEVFHSLNGHLMQVIPRTATDSFSVSLAFFENIFEPYDYRFLDTLADQSNEAKQKASEDWEANQINWKGVSEYVDLSALRYNYYKFPQSFESPYLETRKKELNLRDTLVIIPAEYDRIATVVYREKACTYWQDDALIRIQQFKNGKFHNVFYVRINLSYGC